MSNIALQLTRANAVEIINTIRVMAGGAQHRLLRSRMAEQIMKVWPEVTDKPDPRVVQGVTRSVTFDTRQMRALAEGFLLLFNHPGPMGIGMTGEEFDALRQTCQMCRCWTWVEKQIDETLKKFEEFPIASLDPERPLEDATPQAAQEASPAQSNIVRPGERIWDARTGLGGAGADGVDEPQDREPQPA